ncbi:MAG: DUF4845 domain-containing protein [Gammaproteobacteria bacterium]
MREMQDRDSGLGAERRHPAGNTMTIASKSTSPSRAASHRHREAGLSLIGWLFVIVIAGLVALAAFRVVPAYVECAQVGSALDNIKKDAKTKSVGTLRTELSNQLMIDSNSGVDLSAFKFKRDGNKLTISINKPIEAPWLGNLGFVVHCHHSITVTRASGY